MDFPGFHLDGGAMVALLALLNTGLLIYAARLQAKTHDLVNGMQAGKVAEAHQLGVTEGAATGGTPPATANP
jgi:hypothetical protein